MAYSHAALMGFVFLLLPVFLKDAHPRGPSWLRKEPPGRAACWPGLGGDQPGAAGLGKRKGSPLIMENQMEKKMENEMETAIYHTSSELGFLP